MIQLLKCCHLMKTFFFFIKKVELHDIWQFTNRFDPVIKDFNLKCMGNSFFGPDIKKKSPYWSVIQTDQGHGLLGTKWPWKSHDSSVEHWSRYKIKTISLLKCYSNRTRSWTSSYLMTLKNLCTCCGTKPLLITCRSWVTT